MKRAKIVETKRYTPQIVNVSLKIQRERNVNKILKNQEKSINTHNMEAFLKGGSVRPREKSAQASSSKEDSHSKRKQVPWVEKYRPKSVEDVAYQDEVVAVLRKSLQGSDLPNLLFYGPPGTGKTSTILAAARELYGVEMMKDRVLELNASDERGIDVVRNKVKTFSQHTASGHRADGKACPPFKIVILDEADSMTSPAQAALRRTMEKESKTTRFCLICNYVSRIIEPIASRCAKFRFKPLVEDILLKRLTEICEKENVSCNEETLKLLIKVSEGDMRKAITSLQSASRLKPDSEVTLEDVNEIAGVVPDEIVDRIITLCQSNSYDKVETGLREIIYDGYSGAQIITQFHDKIVLSEELNDKQKSVICEKLGEVDKCLMDGADEYLQLIALFTVIMQAICRG